MKSAPDQILRPKTPEEAGALLERLGNEAGLLWFGARVEPPETWARASMIDVSDLPLDYVETDQGGVVIGATTPIQRLVEDETLGSAYGGLIHTAARRLAHYGLRNLANLGGALLTRKGPPELALALLALGAQAVVVGADEQTFPLAELSFNEDQARRGLLKELRLPPESAGGGSHLEWLARSPMDQALAAACAAVVVKDGKIASARLSVASLGWPPGLMGEAEAHLKGRSASGWKPAGLAEAVHQAVAPEAEFRGSAGYQTEMMARLAGRAVAEALKKAGA